MCDYGTVSGVTSEESKEAQGMAKGSVVGVGSGSRNLEIIRMMIPTTKMMVLMKGMANFREGKGRIHGFEEATTAGRARERGVKGRKGNLGAALVTPMGRGRRKLHGSCRNPKQRWRIELLCLML